MRVCLFEDVGVVNLEPLTLTRPAFDLLCGTGPLGDKQRGRFGATEVGVLVRPQLADLYHLQRPHLPVNDLDWLRAGPTVLVNGRWLPPSDPPGDVAAPHVGMVGDEVAYAVLGPDRLAGCSLDAFDDCLEAWKAGLPQQPAGGALVCYPWDLVEHNAAQIRHDFGRFGSRWSAVPEGGTPAVVGPRQDLWIDPTARIEPMTVTDTTNGPVVIDREAVVAAFSRLEGPCYFGPGTHVLGAKVRAGTTLGPCCRIGGEVEASIVHGHSNKYHDGFLGHSYLGEWINLGAGTQNSDLRNDYGEVTVTVAGRPVPTGLTKVGCFLGDHTKTGLGTLLNTGTNAGVFCNLLPGALLPRYVPSFCSWWNGALSGRVDLPRVLETAAKVMRRRGQALTDAHADLYFALFDQTAAERRWAVHEAERRRLRRMA